MIKRRMKRMKRMKGDETIWDTRMIKWIEEWKG